MRSVRSSCRRPRMRVQSRHSARIVSITRSACALAFGAWIGVTITRAPSERTTASNDRLNFASWSRMRNRTGLVRASRPSARLRACSGDPGRVGVRGRGAEVDPPAAELDEHEDVGRPEPGRLHAEEVAGDDALRLGPQELGPGRPAAPRCGTEPGDPKQGADRRRAGSDAELPELALHPDTTPARVLPGEPQDERTDLRIDRRPARPTGPAVRPLPPYELAVPAQERRRGDEEGDPAVTRDRTTRRREQDPVDGPELRSARRPLQHPELVAEDEDLEVLGSVVLALRADGRGCGRQGKRETPSADRTGGDPSTNRGFRPPRVRRLLAVARGDEWPRFAVGARAMTGLTDDDRAAAAQGLDLDFEDNDAGRAIT